MGVGEDSGWEAWANGAGRGSDLSEGGWNTVILNMSSRQDQARRPEELKEGDVARNLECTKSRGQKLQCESTGQSHKFRPMNVGVFGLFLFPPSLSPCLSFFLVLSFS